MSAEAGGAALLKWAWGLLIPILGWIWRRQDRLEDRVQDRYTKKETVDQIDLRVDPLKQSIDNNTSVTKELSSAIVDLRVEIAHQRKNSFKGE